MKIHHYSVFASAPGGGKQFAIVEGVTDPTEMQRIAASSGQPLTGFILNTDSSNAEVRFFSPTKEKGSSDSGALIIGEHLRRAEAIQDRLIVDAGGEKLEVFYKESKWWSEQGETSRKNVQIPEPELLSALGIGVEALNPVLRLTCSGHEKINILVPINTSKVSYREFVLLQPDLRAISEINQSTKTNGVIVLLDPYHYEVESAHDDLWDLETVVEIHFFAPARGIPEDHAGSYTVATLCGYFGARAKDFTPEEIHEERLIVSQGEAMGKPSTLYATFRTKDKVAQNIQIGGKVELLEVTDV